MNYETLADWCKFLEKNFSPELMIPTLPVIIRLDGNNFSKWTKGLQKPFDENLTDLMVEATKMLVEETNAIIGYTQSDEITLILYSGSRNSAIYNDGKKQKMLSKITGRLTTFFYINQQKFLPNHKKVANFDCRIYQTPKLEDACAQLLWRENDATRNSISMLAQSKFSHEQLKNVDTNQMQDMLMLQHGINWNNLETKFKRGTYVRRTVVNKPFSAEELASLPPKHNAHKNPNLVIERNIINVIEMPIFHKTANKVDVVFKGTEPILFAHEIDNE